MKLLVSIRSVDEAAAVVGNVDLLDIKEPTRGSLGAATPELIAEIATRHRSDVPISAALGELLEIDAQQLRAMPSVDFVKFGMAGCADVPNWPDLWRDACRQLSGTPRVVAVYYADASAARCPSWESILEHAIEIGCPILLVDTFDKANGRLWDWMSMGQLKELKSRTQSVGMQLAIAGSLTEEDVPSLVQIDASIVAVRSAVCIHGRDGLISREKTKRLAAQLGCERSRGNTIS